MKSTKDMPLLLSRLPNLFFRFPYDLFKKRWGIAACFSGNELGISERRGIAMIF
jgi:hypothetical protein